MSSPNPSRETKPDFHRPPIWAPRFWHGMRVATWWHMLFRNRFAVGVTRAPTAFAISCLTPINDIMYGWQSLRFGREIAKTEPVAPPLFVIGHWRSGTTLLHELLVADDRFASPNTYQCFAPWHFLVSEWMMTRFGNFLMPEKRPMDNMKAGWTLPQEDEFALMNMGCPSPYTRIAFPLNGPVHQATLDMEGLTDEELHVWKTRLHWFVKALTVRYQKQLVMKSPPHTGRIGVLHQMYPESRFIHISRDPRKIFPSTLRLWQSLDDIQGMQRSPAKEAYEEFVFESLTRMYQGFEKQRALLPPGSIIDLRYEDLIADPVGQLRELYKALGIDDFDRILPAIRERLDSDRDYRTNRHSMSAEQEQRILSRWHDYAKRYGYLQSPQGMKNAS